MRLASAADVPSEGCRKPSLTDAVKAFPQPACRRTVSLSCGARTFKALDDSLIARLAKKLWNWKHGSISVSFVMDIMNRKGN